MTFVTTVKRNTWFNIYPLFFFFFPFRWPKDGPDWPPIIPIWFLIISKAVMVDGPFNVPRNHARRGTSKHVRKNFTSFTTFQMTFPKSVIFSQLPLPAIHAPVSKLCILTSWKGLLKPFPAMKEVKIKSLGENSFCSYITQYSVTREICNIETTQ